MDARAAIERLSTALRTYNGLVQKGQRRRFTLLCWACAAMLSASTAQAAIVNIGVEGTVLEASGFLDGPLSVGESFTGFFAYDDVVADSNPSPTVGGYFGGITEFDLALSGGATFDNNFGIVFVASDLAGSTWITQGQTNTSFGVPVGSFVNLSFSYIGPSGLFLDDGIAQPTLSDPSLFDSTLIDIRVMQPSGDGAIAVGTATLEIVGSPDRTVVSEPPAIALLGLGLTGLLVRRKRLRRRQLPTERPDSRPDSRTSK